MIKIYGIREQLQPIRRELSDLINSCMVDALEFPPSKRAHRFFPMDREDFFFPEGRTEAYTVLEIQMMQGRSAGAKHRLMHLLFERAERQLGILPRDLEINILESPAHDWGFRGMTGAEADLDYPIDV
jgi:hypothetical protein